MPYQGNFMPLLVLKEYRSNFIILQGFLFDKARSNRKSIFNKQSLLVQAKGQAPKRVSSLSATQAQNGAQTDLERQLKPSEQSRQDSNNEGEAESVREQVYYVRFPFVGLERVEDVITFYGLELPSQLTQHCAIIVQRHLDKVRHICLNLNLNLNLTLNLSQNLNSVLNSSDSGFKYWMSHHLFLLVLQPSWLLFGLQFLHMACAFCTEKNTMCWSHCCLGFFPHQNLLEKAWCQWKHA